MSESFRVIRDREKKKESLKYVIMFGSMIIFSVICIVLAICINDIGGTRGEHTGVVTAVEERDNILWDSTLVYFKTDAETTQEDIYCVNDGSVRNKLEAFAKEKKQVTLEYSNNFLFMRSDCNGGDSVIYDVVENKGGDE